MGGRNSVVWTAKANGAGLYAKGRTRGGSAPATPVVSRTTSASASSTYTTTPPATTFVHPGVMYSQAQLDATADQIAANDPLKTSALNALLALRCGGQGAQNGTNSTYVYPGDTSGAKGMRYSDLNWAPHPVASVGRGSFNSGGIEDDNLQDDMHAALCHMLIYRYTGERAHANVSNMIMNVWAQTITEIRFDLNGNQDGKLLAGWTGSNFARTAEVMRYNFTPGAGDVVLDVTNIKRVLRDIWWPRIGFGHAGVGFNTYTSCFDAMMQIAVFLDDRAKFDRAVEYLRMIMPGLVYKTGDNNPWPWAHPAGGTLTYPNGDVLQCPTGLPMPTKSVWAPDTNVNDRSTTTPNPWMDNTGTNNCWKHPLFLPNGLWAETGRDFHHTAFGIGGVGNGMETAWHQGVDLYAEWRDRLVPSLELTTGYIIETYPFPIGPSNPGSSYPANWPFPQSSKFASSPRNTQLATFEILHHHYAVRQGLSLPKTTRFLEAGARAETYDVDLHICWETLTHYGTP